ncbi:hypothetical protein AB0M95_38265 [Sphaerisporangium sp. NPDC051017]|uniref:hypothetical protein n=1 Tax=Sphaerisporangium sp. NPDC051017 TaxID=3154636 RepID=UPI00343A2375
MAPRTYDGTYGGRVMDMRMTRIMVVRVAAVRVARWSSGGCARPDLDLSSDFTPPPCPSARAFSV